MQQQMLKEVKDLEADAAGPAIDPGQMEFEAEKAGGPDVGADLGQMEAE
jgi:hypothetical protein